MLAIIFFWYHWLDLSDCRAHGHPGASLMHLALVVCYHFVFPTGLRDPAERKPGVVTLGVPSTPHGAGTEVGVSDC